MGEAPDDERGPGGALPGGAIGVVCVLVVIALGVGLGALVGGSILYAVCGFVYRREIQFRRAFITALVCEVVTLLGCAWWYVIASELGRHVTHGSAELTSAIPALLRWTVHGGNSLAMLALIGGLVFSITGGMAFMRREGGGFRGVTGGFGSIVLVVLCTAAGLITCWLYFAILEHGRNGVDTTVLAIVVVLMFCGEGSLVLALITDAMAGAGGPHTAGFTRTYGVMFVGCLVTAVIALVIEHGHAGLAPMAHTLAEHVRGLIRDPELDRMAPYGVTWASRLPPIRDAWPGFLLTLAPGMLVLAAAAVLALGRVFRRRDTLVKLPILLAAMALVALELSAIVGLVADPARHAR